MPEWHISGPPGEARWTGALIVMGGGTALVAYIHFQALHHRKVNTPALWLPESRCSVIFGCLLQPAWMPLRLLEDPPTGSGPPVTPSLPSPSEVQDQSLGTASMVTLNVVRRGRGPLPLHLYGGPYGPWSWFTYCLVLIGLSLHPKGTYR